MGEVDLGRHAGFTETVGDLALRDLPRRLGQRVGRDQAVARTLPDPAGRLAKICSVGGDILLTIARDRRECGFRRSRPGIPI